MKLGDIVIEKTLRYVRKQKGIKQDTVAKRLEIGRTTIASYEQGYREPTFETIQRIVNCCGYEIFFINKDTNDCFRTIDIDRNEV